AQSQAIGVPLVTGKVTWETYEQVFKELVSGLKKRGVKGCVFGDVWVAEHKEWTERICNELGIKALSPLFGEKPEDLFRELVNLGFEALVVTVKKEYLGEEWLGRKLDQEFLEELLEAKKNREIDVLGELGEYHTFVCDGPMFKKRIQILETHKVSKNGYAYLEINRFKLIDK
ncbi:MAG: diphthine--ammonia ligase, partial [Candidatus Jordarchaeaceae archaeon]